MFDRNFKSFRTNLTLYSILVFQNTYKTSKLISLFILFLFIGTYFIHPIIYNEPTFYSTVDLSFESETEPNSEETEKLNDLEDLFYKNQLHLTNFNCDLGKKHLFFEFFPDKPILKIPIPPPELA